MKQPKPHLVGPGLIARTVINFYGRLASLGLGPSYSFLLLAKA